MSAVCIIPARGGSKRIARKNIKPFCGQPMLAYSVQAALASHCFDRVVVSTDDDEIAALARAYGAEVPFVRPAALADDHTGTTAVVKHALQWLAAHHNTAEVACCLYATAPFVRAADIRRGLDVLRSGAYDYAFSVTSFAFPIQRALRQQADGALSMFQPENFAVRSQDLEEAWHDAGQFYWGTAAAWLAEKPIFNSRAQAVVLPRHRVQDIDTPEDWLRAEYLFRALQAAEAPA